MISRQPSFAIILIGDFAVLLRFCYSSLFTTYIANIIKISLDRNKNRGLFTDDLLSANF